MSKIARKYRNRRIGEFLKELNRKSVAMIDKNTLEILKIFSSIKEAEAYLIKSLGKTLSEVALGYDTYVNINRIAKYCDFIAIGLKVILK